MTEETGARITRVRLSSYRSIAACDVRLGPLTFLVGPNGSGKSNFLDALSLVSEGLTGPLAEAIRSRGGPGEVVTKPGNGTSGARIEIQLSVGPIEAEYLIEFTADNRALIRQEACRVRVGGVNTDSFTVRYGELVETTEVHLPDPGDGRLYLVAAGSLGVFRPVYDALQQMAFYDFKTDLLKGLQEPDAGKRLRGDGGNLASVVEALGDSPGKAAIEDYLAAVVPGVKSVTTRPVDVYRNVYFSQHRGDFAARSVSDGTVRALAVLTAIFQPGECLVGIEEPETGVHPAAAAVLREALIEASRRRQLIVTSHSPELLDDPELPAEAIVAVRAADDLTEIGPLDAAGRFALRDHLYTAGELLRLDQLTPERGEPES